LFFCTGLAGFVALVNLVVVTMDFEVFGLAVVRFVAARFVLVRFAMLFVVVVMFLFKTVTKRFETFFTAVESHSVKPLLRSDSKLQSLVRFETLFCFHTTDGTSVLTLAANLTVVRKLLSVLTVLVQKVNVLKTKQLMHMKMRRNNTMI